MGATILKDGEDMELLRRGPIGRRGPNARSMAKNSRNPSNRINRVRKLRFQYGMTQQEFADFVGLGRTAITYMESGNHTLQHQSARKIADAFGVSIDYVMGIGPDEESPYKTFKLVKPDRKGYYIVAFTPQGCRWNCYCVAYWDGKMFRTVGQEMGIGTELSGVTNWMMLPMVGATNDDGGDD